MNPFLVSPSHDNPAQLRLGMPATPTHSAVHRFSTTSLCCGNPVLSRSDGFLSNGQVMGMPPPPILPPFIRLFLKASPNSYTYLLVTPPIVSLWYSEDSLTLMHEDCEMLLTKHWNGLKSGRSCVRTSKELQDHQLCKTFCKQWWMCLRNTQLSEHHLSLWMGLILYNLHLNWCNKASYPS